MENWNQFVNEEMSQEGTLAAALEKEGFDAEMAARLADELMDEKEVVQVVSKMDEMTAKDAGAFTGATIGSLAYVVAQFHKAMNTGESQEQIVQILSNDSGNVGALMAALGVYGVIAIKSALKDAMRDPAEKDRETFRPRMEEGMEEEDEEMSLEDLIGQLTGEQIVSAVNNWAKSGNHTTSNLRMNLDKKMQDLGGKPKAGGRMGLYAPEVYEEGEELDEKIEKTKGGKYYATSKTGRRLSKKPKTKEAALKQLAAVEASKAERKK